MCTLVWQRSLVTDGAVTVLSATTTFTVMCTLLSHHYVNIAVTALSIVTTITALSVATTTTLVSTVILLSIVMSIVNAALSVYPADALMCCRCCHSAI